VNTPPACPPGFFAAAAIVARKDLRIEGRTKETLSATVLFALVELVVFGFAFDLDTIRRMGPGKVVPGLLWMTLAFSAIVGFTRSFRLERAREALTAVALAPIDRGAVFVGKWIANFALLLMLEAVLLPLTALFFDVNIVEVAAPLVLVVVLHTAGLAALGTLFSGVVSRLGRGEALLATLLLPAATPLFLSAVHCTASVLEATPLASDRKWLLLTAGLDVLYVLVAILIFDAILEE
jgi:heme exporter protein B